MVEDYDREGPGNPGQYILACGGHILFAIDGEERALGTVALKHEGDGVYELTKMAVSPEASGRGVGRLLMDAALYESVGFGHHPAPRAGSHCARADVHMIWEP